MRSLTEPLKESADYCRIVSLLSEKGAGVLADDCVPSQKQHLIYAISKEPELAGFCRFRVIITYSDKRAMDLRDQYTFFDRTTTVFPARDLIFYQADLRGREIETERLKCLRRIMEGRPMTVVTTFAALMTPQIPLAVLKKAILPLAKRDVIGMDEIADHLSAMGYEKNAQVNAPGQFAIRGDILDVFDLTEENPIRIEFFDDEIDSIRSFDAESQRSMESLESVRIYPAAELILDGRRLADGLDRMRSELKTEEERFRKNRKPEEASRLHEEVCAVIEEAQQWHSFGKLESFIHYFYPSTQSFLNLFPEDSTMLFFDEPVRIREQADAVETEFRESMISRSEKGLCLPGQMQLISSGESVASSAEHYRKLEMTGLVQNSTFTLPDHIVSVHARPAASYNKSFDSLEKDLKKYRLEKYRVVIISASRTRAKRLAQDLTGRGISAFYSENPDRVLEPGEIMTYYGRIAHGFEYPNLKFIVIAETDIFGTKTLKKKKKKKLENGELIRDFSDLRAGDYVVHEDYGIGIYRGVEKIEVGGIVKDYIKVEYGGGGILYILPNDLNVLQKYASQGTAKPKLNKLGSSEWKTTKSRVKGAVEEVAQDLVNLYAARQHETGYAFGPDTVWQKEFEEMFPYEETQDQLTAIEDTKNDMESDKIMDRLICGDVGYGKTEIALRAAFKAVQDGKQAAVLVPTTILAQQHFNTFTERMRDFPVNIEMLSRFRTPAEQKKTIEGLKNGSVDIVVGTHRVLSQDVQFRDLGLLVIDEEQRFGVSAKEKIKKLKQNVDVLTMTATPIPRTLHMSLVGIRDMSILEEAPQDRVPIQTYVMEYNEELVREAILRELSRKGQVYYVYNRVNDIADLAGRIQTLVPEARVSYAHGQMSEQELEKIMYDFVSGEIDVLVSTTIIETGLDIPNVNTIIIHDSDRMGLSQLYQLRGRVGRSNRTAYAFLMYRKDRMLREEAEKRLSAIKEFTDLGSGFRIAMRDLEIRGAGSVLGRAQHGHMAAVGYDLYCKLLESAVREVKGEPVKEEINVKVSLSVDAFIPGTYIPNEAQKLDIYKKIAVVSSLEDCDDVRDEMRDRFGEPIPQAAENLLRIALIRSIAAKLDITDITGGGGSVRLTLQQKADIHVENIPKLLAKYHGNLHFVPRGMPRGEQAGKPYFDARYSSTGVAVRDEETLLATVEGLLSDFADILRNP